MKRYLLRGLMLGVLALGCTIKPLLSSIEQAKAVVDNSLSNSLRISRIAPLGKELYLGALGLWQRGSDFSWTEAKLPAGVGPGEQPVVDIFALTTSSGSELWLATATEIYQKLGDEWIQRRNGGKFPFGATFLAVKEELLVYDQKAGESLVFQRASNDWSKLSVSGQAVALVEQGGNYLLATQEGLWQGSSWSALAKLKLTGLNTPPGITDPGITDLLLVGSTYYLAASGSIYASSDGRTWTKQAGPTAVLRLTQVQNFLLATRAQPGFGVWNLDKPSWAPGGSGDGFSVSDSFLVKAGDKKLPERLLEGIIYHSPNGKADEARLYAWSVGAHGLYSAHNEGGRWSWARE